MRNIVVIALSTLFVLQTASPTVHDDYGFLWWAHGWRSSSPEGARVLSVQTNHYGLAVDVHKPAVLHLGDIPSPRPYAEAVADANDVVFGLPSAALSLSVTVGDTRYTCTKAAENTDDRPNYPIRLIESGQVVQRFDINHLVFENQAGDELPATGRLEVIAWPEALHLILEITPAEDLPAAQLGIGLNASAQQKTTDALKSGQPVQVALTWRPTTTEPVLDWAQSMAVRDTRTGDEVPVTYDAARGWNHVALPDSEWTWADEPDRQDRFSVRITNPGEQPIKVPINFARRNWSGVLGTTPLLRDKEALPTGIPVQVSKNWHSQHGKIFLYEGPWFHGFSQIPVGPGETWEGELVLVYAQWGGVPAASHAQLSLIGWGTNQRWDQVAIGSWGEMFCYDPDVNLNRSMIDDVRPLMVNGMHDNGPWQWTVNVGGGDFLVYFDEAGEKQYLSRMRTAYLEPGPNQTRTVYAGQTPKGELEARIEVSSPRCDDVSRAFHTFRYDVKKPMPFSRLAFYQLGADNYNDHQFTKLARGNAAGLSEEWDAPQGGKTYHRTAIPCEGDTPWFSLHGGVRDDEHAKGAWANRGLIIHAWKARLGGEEVPHPIAAIYGTENKDPSANVELVPPPGLTELLPGDFVEAEVEFVVIPAEPGTYYGPNAPFKEHLEANIDTWKPVHRLAAMTSGLFEVTKGTLQRRYPIEIATNPQGEASLEFRMGGTPAYVPVTFTGLPQRTGYRLQGISPEAEQFVQIAYDDANGTWSRTYNVYPDVMEKGVLSLQRHAE